MPRKIQDKELNDIRRIVEIFKQHTEVAQHRMLEYIKTHLYR